jgi:hypothetical protein
MKILSLDLSSETGWSIFINGLYHTSGTLEKIFIEDFNVNNNPNKSNKYPLNIINAINQIVQNINEKYLEYKPDIILIEGSVKGKNRHTQKFIEWLHLMIFLQFKDIVNVKYMDVSEWRKIVNLKLSKEDKINNKLVKIGKKRGKINKKHLSVRMVNILFNLNKKLKDHNECDSILLGKAYIDDTRL